MLGCNRANIRIWQELSYPEAHQEGDKVTIQEACERIETLMAQPYHHNLQRVKAILEDLEKSAYERGYKQGGKDATPSSPFVPIFPEDEGA